MQPHAPDIPWLNIIFTEVLHDKLGDHGHNFTENLAALLDKQFVGGQRVFGCCAVEEAKIVANVIGELGNELGANNFPLLFLVGRGMISSIG